MSSSASTPDRLFPTFRRWAGSFGGCILQLQLRADLRRIRFFVVQFICLLILSCFILGRILVMAQDRSLTATQIGQSLFTWFFCVEYVVILVVFPAFSSTAFTDERVGQTLDLLLTTNLRPREIVWGKFLASSIYCFLYVFASIPLLSLAFLFGGIQLSEVLAAYAILVGLTLLVCMLGLCISSLFSANVRSTLVVYALVVCFLIISWSVWSDLQEMLKQGRSQTIVGALLEMLEPRRRVSLRAVIGLFAGVLLFAYLFLITTNRIRPPWEDRSSGLRLLSMISIGLVAGSGPVIWAARGGLAPPGPATGLLPGVFSVLGTQEGMMLVLALCLFAVALVFPTEEARVSALNRRRFGSLRGPAALLRLFAPGAFWGFVYTVTLSVMVCGSLSLVWLNLVGPPGSEGSMAPLFETLTTLPPYVAAFAALGFLLSALDFTPLYSRLTVFFVFLITLLLPGIFMISKIPDSIWTCYYFSPWTLAASLGEQPLDAEPRFVLYGMPVIWVAKIVFTALALLLFAVALKVCHRSDYPTLRLDAGVTRK